MSRSQTQTGPTLGAPEWAGDFLNREHLIPGGAKVNAADAGFVADSAGRKPIPAGTVIARTIAERDASTGFGPAADTDPASETYIVAFDVTDANDINDVELYRPNSIVKENFLPGWGALSAAVKALVRARYLCTRGAE
jgi:hypothetical protein